MTSEPSFIDPGSPMLGRVLLGRYRIMRELAKGGMGVVYLARAEGAIGFVKPVVVKLILPDYCDNAEFVGMFAREAQILSHLRDPGIVDVIEFGQDSDAYVMVLEYVRGYHLGQWQKYLNIKRRVIPVQVAMLLTIDVLDALEHAHTAKHSDGSPMSIVHRDISPSNIMLDSAGRARLLDFGVARMRGGEQMYKTQVAGFRGKLSYSAPELFSGIEASPASDLYACGIVLHEMLLGHNTFRGSTQSATFHNVLTKRPESVHSVREDAPDGLDAVVEKALAKEPGDRFESAGDFASALRDVLPKAEREIRKEVIAQWAMDFDTDMASVLGVESLHDRDELWRRLSHPPEELITGSGAMAPERTRISRATRNTQRGQESRTPSSTGGFTPNRPIPPIPPRPVNLPGAGSTPAFQNRLLLAVAGLVVVAVAVVLVALAVVVRQPAAPAPAPVQVYTTSTAPEVVPSVADPAAVAAAEPAAVEEETDVGAVQEDVKEASPVVSRKRPTKKTKGPDASALTRAFRAKHQAVQTCFASYAATVQGSPQIEVEFSIDAAGHLQRAELYPPAVRGSTLGGCILKVAKQTSFPGQGEALTFRIPVTAKRVQ